MPGPILHAGATLTCPHGGAINILAVSPRVLVGGAPAAVLTDQGLVAGCAFVVGPKPQPCVTTKWMMGAMRVLAGGQPVLIAPPAAFTQSIEQIPGGPPIVIQVQPRVIAT